MRVYCHRRCSGEDWLWLLLHDGIWQRRFDDDGLGWFDDQRWCSFDNNRSGLLNNNRLRRLSLLMLKHRRLGLLDLQRFRSLRRHDTLGLLFCNSLLSLGLACVHEHGSPVVLLERFLFLINSVELRVTIRLSALVGFVF